MKIKQGGLQMIQEFISAAKEGDLETMTQLKNRRPELLKERAENGESPLLAALYHGKMRTVEWLLERDIDLNIHEAAALGDEAYMQYLLEQDANLVATHSYDGWTALHLACFFGGLDAAKLLIQSGADTNARSTNRMANTPIHAAAAARKFELAKLLLDHGADVNADQQGGWTPLHQTVTNYDFEMTRLLLNHKADPTHASEKGETPITIAMEKGYDDLLAVLHGEG
jgi:ankyrin repeat protein